MIFMFFAAGISAVFFVCSLVALHCGRALGLRYRKHEGAASMAGLATVEGAIFGLMGLLLAFTISGALQRFDDAGNWCSRRRRRSPPPTTASVYSKGTSPANSRTSSRNMSSRALTFIACGTISCFGKGRRIFLVSNRTSWFSTRTTFGMRPSRPAQRAPTNRHVHSHYRR